MNIRTLGRIIATGLMVLPFTLTSGSATAYDTYGGSNDYHLTGGVNGRQYYLFASVGSTLESLVYSGKWSWGNAMPGVVAWAETTNVNNAEMNYLQTSVDFDYCAYTQFFGSSANEIDPETSNYAYTKTTIPPDFFSGCTNRQGVITHEIGHTMGLDHEDSASAAIMRTYIAFPSYCCGGSTWTAPKSDDENGINHIY